MFALRRSICTDTPAAATTPHAVRIHGRRARASSPARLAVVRLGSHLLGRAVPTRSCFDGPLGHKIGGPAPHPVVGVARTGRVRGGETRRDDEAGSQAVTCPGGNRRARLAARGRKQAQQHEAPTRSPSSCSSSSLTSTGPRQPPASPASADGSHRTRSSPTRPASGTCSPPAKSSWSGPWARMPEEPSEPSLR